jgi:ribosomal protein L11 methyltransferase
MEISVETDHEAAEALSALFYEYGHSRAVIEEMWEDGAETPIIRVKAYLSPQQSATLPRIEEALWHLGQIYPIPAPSVRWLSEADWLEAWKSGFTLQRIGRHIVVKPSWQGYAAAPDEVVIELDPGLAFGTGLHPTTRLCLEAAEDHVQPGDRVLDVGTGSGILAIAAAKLGAAHILALDTDSMALQVAEENAARNGVDGVISLQRASLHRLAPQRSREHSDSPNKADGGNDLGAPSLTTASFDLLMMNILASVIIESAAAIAASLTAKGLFVVSGILESQEDAVSQAFVAQGLQITERRVQSDWVALIGGKESSRAMADERHPR